MIKATFKPGQNGTKRLAEKYGDRLVCARYRYDEEIGTRCTTVELIEESSAWRGESVTCQADSVSSQLLAVRMDYYETELREKVKAAGGISRPRQKLQELPCKNVVALGLESLEETQARLSNGRASRSRYLDPAAKPSIACQLAEKSLGQTIGILQKAVHHEARSP